MTIIHEVDALGVTTSRAMTPTEQADYDARMALAAQVKPQQVDRERDRRIAAGFMFGGVQYQSRPEDRENLAGASTAALAAIMAGAQAGDYRWHGGDVDFVWIADDNTSHPMDAQTVFALGQAAMAHKQSHIFAARTLKDMEPIPVGYKDDILWP